MDLFERYPQLNICKNDIENALSLMIDTYKKGGKILVCGNGGSSADADHIVGELMKGFLKTRKVTDERSECCDQCSGFCSYYGLSGRWSELLR